jgi:hypothetical protein
MPDLEQLLVAQNRFLIGFDLALGTATLLAPDQTLRTVFGHREPSDDARETFRRRGMWFAGASNLAMAAGFARLAHVRATRRRGVLARLRR